MQFSKVLIIGPGFEQRVSKMAFCFTKLGIKCEVLAEDAQVAEEFTNYIKDIPFYKIPVNERLKRTPLGHQRIAFIKEKIILASHTEKKVLIIARDVNYGAIVTDIVRRLCFNNIFVVTDVADNYDLLYASFNNPIKKLVLKLGFHFLTKKAFEHSDALLIVSAINEQRIKYAYFKTQNKPILLLRNLPLFYKYYNSQDKIPKSFVYVGKIDEISRDPFYVLEKLKELKEYTLHFYSNQKRSTIEKICATAKSFGLNDRVFVHKRVPYDELSKEISRYSFGLVPHKRSPITDYTVPNKIYDYKSSGIVTIMSDCPSLVNENNEFGFGVTYSKEKDNFVSTVKNAENYKLDFSIQMPTWTDEFYDVIDKLDDIFDQKRAV